MGEGEIKSIFTKMAEFFFCFGNITWLNLDRLIAHAGPTEPQLPSSSRLYIHANPHILSKQLEDDDNGTLEAAPNSTCPWPKTLGKDSFSKSIKYPFHFPYV